MKKELPSLETIGTQTGSFPVELSIRFLEHFSEQLYSSPQKAFEELISNSWDAGADCVDVRISTDLNDPNATMCVLDNGISMDAHGLRQLWHIAFSPKKDTPELFGRPIIGKFGIGKLATYVLTNRLTYICKAPDGIIRRVTMDYGKIDRQEGFDEDRLISQLRLDLFEVGEAEVEAALQNIYDGGVILDLIRKGVHHPEGVLGEDEFGGQKAAFTLPNPGTWTLVVLSDLKSIGRELKIGILRRMLESALPFGSEMAISVNGELLSSSKIDVPTMEDWIIGPGLGINNIELSKAPDMQYPATIDLVNGSQPAQAEVTKIPLKYGEFPVPYVELPEIGRVTGRVRLFQMRISGGKSDVRGPSNGFHVNVLGRVVNQTDLSFGEENLSHAAWSRFRMAVRADGLNKFLTTNREQFKDCYELDVFRAFLRKVFNKARTRYDSDQSVELPDGGDVLVRSLGVLSLSPLRNVVTEALMTKASLPSLFDDTGIDDREEKRKSWQENTRENIKNVLDKVKFDRLEDDSFVKFRISDSTIIINKEHPFYSEHSRSKAEKELLRTIGMVNLLSDAYAIDIGVQPSIMESIQEYRDHLMRYRALQRRKSGTYIAKLLIETQHKSENSRLFEAVLYDALRYLGFQVRELAKSGEPEGIASAYSTPSSTIPTRENPHPPLYSVSFDAKSTKHDSVQTGNINLDGVVEHRKRYGANYALVVAPGFTGDAIVTRCTQQKVTPMMASDLGRLLEYTVEYGAIPVTKIGEVFQLYDPDAVSEWVKELKGWMQEKRQLTIDIFLKALERLEGKIPDALPAGMIAYECREHLGVVSVLDNDVIAVAHGLSILIPDLIGLNGEKIIVNASPERIAAAVSSQLENLFEEEPIENKNQQKL